MMKKNISILAVVLCVALLFVSCGGKKAATTATTTTATTTTAAPAAAAPAKTEAPAPAKAETPAPAATETATTAPASDKVVFRIANGSEPESLDPAKVQGTPEHRIYEALFEGLIIFDPVTADGIPGLAESWDVSEDGLTYTFHLRQANWSDGTPITANDVVFSWLRELAPETASPYAWFPAMFLAGASEYNSGEAGADAVQIKALDDYTFQMTLIGPLPYVIGALGHYSFAVVPQHTIEQYGDKWILPENFVGNGPYVLKEWTPQDKIVCDKNENYWDKDNVKLDQVVFYASDDDNTNYNMYLAGQIDWLTGIPQDKLDSAMLRDDYQVAPQLSTYYYTIQTTKAPFDDARVRRALALAVDRETLVETITKAGQIPAWGIVPDMAGYNQLEFPYDGDMDSMIAEAQDLLAEAGYPNGVGFPSFSLLYNTNDAHKMIAEFVQKEWKENLGIDCQLENQEWATYLSNRNAGNFDVARAGWTGDYQDPNTFLDMFITGAGMNGGKYSNDVYDTLINEAAKMAAGEDRMEVLRTAEDTMINEDQAIIPFYYYASTNIIDTNKWGGWHTNTMDYHPTKDIYLK